jgi:hypothetical protein
MTLKSNDFSAWQKSVTRPFGAILDMPQNYISKKKRYATKFDHHNEIAELIIQLTFYFNSKAS